MRPSDRRRDFGFGPWGFDDMFGDFEAEFERMRAVMDQAFSGVMDASPGEGGPRVYGFRYSMGPDGVPHFERFGNVGPGGELHPTMVGGCGCGPEGEAGGECRLAPGPSREGGQREPLIDVVEADKELYVCVELPGVDREDLAVEADDETLHIKANTEGREFSKDVPLPSRVKPGSVKATMRNGVLSVTMQKAKPKKPAPRKKVDIE